MLLRIGLAAAFLIAVVPCSAIQPSPAAERAFQTYVAKLEAKLARQHASPETYRSLLNLDARQRAAAERRLLSGAITIIPVNGGAREISGALLHDWRGALFIPDATAAELLSLLRDYKSLPRHYAPDILSAHVLAGHGNFADVEIRLRKHITITVVLDAEYQVESALTGSNRGYSWSRSKHIWQIDQPGTPAERRRPESAGGGLLWHLNSYWSFIQWRGGLLVECEAVSLTRDVPAGMGWAIMPVIQNLSRTSLEFTLEATQRALTAIVRERADR